MPAPRFLGRALLDDLCAQAAASPRRRRNHNLHANTEDPAQRFFNALQPDSYVVPHRHIIPGKEETLIVVRGRLGVLFFDDRGDVTETRVLSPGGDDFGLFIPTGLWHSVIALEPAVFFEAKRGPYRPLEDSEFAPWAPAEGTDGAATCLAMMRRHFTQP
ncbi:WbuC family cupin fold metalloprotein [Uliginosibacterium sp. sgz301328]|uniref:WbuC family cupin fold metalloprotein n=1 Tax=Uliginosibacterium sp. sgz301328 TaxID=3243764 RepID=UPI00359CF5AA